MRFGRGRSRTYQHSLMKAKSCSSSSGERMYFSAVIAACRCRAMIFSSVTIREWARAREACMSLSSSGGGSQSSFRRAESSCFEAWIKDQLAESIDSTIQIRNPDGHSEVSFPKYFAPKVMSIYVWGYSYNLLSLSLWPNRNERTRDSRCSAEILRWMAKGDSGGGSSSGIILLGFSVRSPDSGSAISLPDRSLFEYFLK